MTITVKSEKDIDRAAREFLEAAGARRHIAFHAPMGAGKTTFTSAICRVLGVTDDVSSPTFSIINEYRDRDNRPVFHFDFYRIDNDAQAFDLGLDEYFDSGALCLMEWPENAEAFLPDDTLHVSIGVLDDGSRIISFDD
ncbi:MAG: tRNA (adenosine(37)-N6)-threonylcarbamoyltransferase complex ATPase subunit type 1 TsaE [Muribaculaceae bacterium]|nr:tRNA (adenosine(37)-N6)-threonylcarbamoyltransferase complex ATPase subunit type 1 TsaE [Muribaculaceae bacterium]